MVLSYTSFGNQSIQTLCLLDYLNPYDSFPYHKDEGPYAMASRLQELHLEGCKGKGRPFVHYHGSFTTELI
jgi:hypothetical protein